MRILVTGSRGLLGSAFRRTAPEYQGHDFVFDPVLDLRVPEQARALLEETRPEGVIHCAAKVGGVKLNQEQPETMFHDNILLSANMIHHAALLGVKKFVAFGSNCAFGDVPELRPDNIQVGEPYASNRAYGYAKRMTAIHLTAAREQYGMATQYVVPVSMFGPNDNFNLQNAHVIPALIHKCYLARDELPVWGDGSAEREVVYAEDVARVVLDLLGKDVPSAVIGSGQCVSVRAMAEAVARHMDFRGKIVWKSEQPGGQKLRPPARIYPFSFTPFEEAVRRTCNWFKDNYRHART